MRSRGIPLLALAVCLATAPARAQPCLGLPLEAGDHTAGALVETETSHTLIAALYAGSSRAFAWRAHAGGFTRDFPGSFPGGMDPAVGAGLAWVGGKRGTCPTVSFDYVGDDPDVTVVTLGWGAGFETLPDSTRAPRAVVFVVPELRWIRSAARHADVETDFEFAFEAGVTAALRPFWAGAGARVRIRESNDYPLDAVMLLRAGVRW